MTLRFPPAGVAAALLLAASLTAPTPTSARQPVESLIELRTRHVVLQQWDLSCGAAALATVLRYQHGEPVTERSVALGLIQREEYLQNPALVRLRSGFSLLDMQRFVERLGYRGIGLGQMSFADLVAMAPVIVPVDSGGYPHFVVFRGAAGSRVLLADPAFGNLTQTREHFLQAWINYNNLGRVGFVVEGGARSGEDNLLQPGATEFLGLK